MTSSAVPGYRTGKICYLEIPAVDAERSADFYHRAFGWAVRHDSDGRVAFDDTVGGVSGRWVVGRAPATEPGLVVSIMVADAGATVVAITAAGGEIVRPVDEDAEVQFAWFRDPAGNVLGIYQQPGLAAAEADAELVDMPESSKPMTRWF
ncbi:putative enzyme related to lactoylglutathione lyase [Kitasatospora sp. MAA4]|uniref:VOC family protein n=1 Tax=Kitasatospora sp. MAA4 TaxID=3035093 RepID=UPI00247352A6|nr:VOC family protein [Kitasatospora sp. MAA4]MDH6133771.1 putative enzyme related to lactoylglutathione lyase [Kitasatospora sp. MAA4]